MKKNVEDEDLKKLVNIIIIIIKGHYQPERLEEADQECG